MKIPLKVILSLSIIVLCPALARANTAHSKTKSLYQFENASARITKSQLQQFEQKLTDYFASKISGANRSIPAPSQADYFMIAKHWNLFSQAFKTLYTQYQNIDPTLNRLYVSPGGHFEIYFADTGKYAVAPDDAYGYSASQWREKTPLANGVPDYIDEIAWALDSAWSMEIDRFGFVAPIVYTDNTHKSSRYKVKVDITLPEDDSDYGVTEPAMGNGTTVGTASILRIRNNWIGFTTPINYEQHPNLALRVTCVHEFFHAIQYSMTWKETNTDTTFLDDFPVSWLGGTAVLMEDLGFDSVNDYIQYTDYFSKDPSSTILNNSNTFVYTTGLLAMFLYERTSSLFSIDYVKKIFFNNYAKPLGFLANLDSVAKSFNTTWPELYGRFFTESYYCGSRSQAGLFIHDAPLIKPWTLHIDNPDIAYSIRKTVPSFGMKTFALAKKSFPDGALPVEFFGDTLVPNSSSNFWGLYCLLRKSGSFPDSIVQIPMTSHSRAQSEISNWPGFDTAIFVVVNAQGNASKNAALVFQPCPISMHAGDSATVVATLTQPLSSASGAQVKVLALQDLACSLSIQSASATVAQKTTAIKNKLVAANVYYAISFPFSWSVSAAITLDVKESSSTIVPLENNYSIGAKAFALFRWDDLSSAWVKSVKNVDSSGVYSWQGQINNPGIYGLFGSTVAPLDSSRADSVSIFPNPVHISRGGNVTINGVALLELLLYNVTGTLVYQAQTSNLQQATWKLTNTRGKTVSPGTYFAMIGYKDPVTLGMKMIKRKILVIP